jgi:tetratricopeptide (TPR) repeat protein
MTPLRASLALAATLFSSALAAQARFAELPPLTADPKVLLAAAAKIDAKEFSTLYLLDSGTFSMEPDGRSRSVWHQIMVVVDEDGVDEAGTASAEWSPWYDEKPLLAARVIGKDGTVHTLDPKAITEATTEAEQDIFSDRRVLRAPLPGVAAGSIVETVITIEGRSPIPGGGSYGRFLFGGGLPIEQSRLVLDTPLSLTPRVVNKAGLQPQTTEKDGRRRIVFEKGRSEAIDYDESYLPSDEALTPYVAFSTGTSWADIARNYGQIVDKQIAGGDLKEAVTKAAGAATERREIIARLLDSVERNVRYAGVEVGDGSIIPRTPRSVLQNKYGDCKDKATLLVALLRTAGIPSHVALLRADSGFDTVADLPGVNSFNHAIVVVDATAEEPALWIDPTDEFAHPGELPLQDQGRMALVATETTTALTRTPEASSTANRVMETRTFTLPEDGKAGVVEVTEGTWAEDASMRRYYASTEKKEYRESIEKYAKSYYVAPALKKLDATDPHDLAHPFRLTLEIEKSKSGVVGEGEGEVLIPLHDIVGFLPDALKDRKEKTPEEEKSDPEKKRIHDFVFPDPKVKEWTYRIIPGPGFTARTLPKSETTKLGSTTLTTQFSTEADGTVVGKLVFDSGKRRLTPAEFTETREALSKLARHDGIYIGFDSAGQTRLAAGDIRGALAEFRKLAELHPKEAQHHIELARALLTGGLGEAARDEARRAVTTEPKNARAHTMLAHVLEYDLLGRHARAGADFPAAIAARRKAKELDPSDAPGRAQLAFLLTYGDGNYRFGRHAHLDESIEEYKALLKDLPKDGARYRPQLMLTQAHAGKWADMKELAQTETDVRQRELFQIMATTITEGAEAGLRELGAFDATKRRDYGSAIFKTLMSLRRYPEAAAFFEATTKGTEEASTALPFVKILRTMQLHEKLLDGSPRGILLLVMDGLLTQDWKALEKLVAPELIDGDEAESMSSFSMRGQPGFNDAPPPVMLDLIGGVIDLQQDGNDETGLRIRMRGAAGMPASTDTTMYLQRRDGRYLIAGFSESPESIGTIVAKLIDEGKLDTARLWLNWARESISAGGGDDPLTGPPFARLWQKEKASATEDELRIAAASLRIVKKSAAKGAPVLASLREKATTDAARTAIDVALVTAYEETKEWEKSLPIAERLATAWPDSGSAFSAWTNTLIRGGKSAEAEAKAKERLARRPKDEAALRTLREVAERNRDYDAAMTWARRLLEGVAASANDYNDAAWLALFRGTDLDRALDDARRATGIPGGESAATLNTLAALYAESGKTLEARQALLKALDQRHTDVPTSSDWFVIGRIAESYGASDAAAAAYKRVTKEEVSGVSTWELMQRRTAVK